VPLYSPRLHNAAARWHTQPRPPQVPHHWARAVLPGVRSVRQPGRHHCSGWRAQVALEVVVMLSTAARQTVRSGCGRVSLCRLSLLETLNMSALWRQQQQRQQPHR
jgi:hypothetical protein